MGCGDKSQKQSWHKDPGLVSPIPDPKLDNCRVYNVDDTSWDTVLHDHFHVSIWFKFSEQRPQKLELATP